MQNSCTLNNNLKQFYYASHLRCLKNSTAKPSSLAVMFLYLQDITRGIKHREVQRFPLLKHFTIMAACVKTQLA